MQYISHGHEIIQGLLVLHDTVSSFTNVMLLAAN